MTAGVEQVAFRNSLRFRVALYAGVSLAQRSLSLLLLPFVTRAMSPAEYGRVAVLTAAGALITIVVGGAVEQAVFRWSVPERRTQSTESALRLGYLWLVVLAPGLGLAIGLALFGIGGSFLQIPSRLWGIEVAAAAMNAGMACFLLPQARAQARIKRYVVLGSIGVSIILAAKLILVMGLRLGSFGWVLSDLVAAVVGLALTVVFVARPKDRATLAGARHLGRFALPLVPHVVSFWALSSLNRPLLAGSLRLDQVAAFSAAYSGVSVTLILLSELNKAMTPEYARADPLRDADRLRRMSTFQICAAGTLTVLIVALAPLYAAVVVPSTFVGVASIIDVLALLPLAYGFYLVVANLLIQTAGLSTRVWMASGAATFVLIIGTVPAARLAGPQGAALVQTLAYGVMAGVVLVVLLRSGVFPMGAVLPGRRSAVLSVVAPLAAVAAAVLSGDAVQPGELMVQAAAVALSAALLLQATQRRRSVL